MTEEDIRHRAGSMLSGLLKLDAFATSAAQRRNFKEAREYLVRAAKNGERADLQVGSYCLAVVSDQIRTVQDGKLKGELRAARRAGKGRQGQARAVSLPNNSFEPTPLRDAA